MGDSTHQERPLQCLQVGRLEEGFVPPNIVRPAMKVKITKSDEGKGMVPPSLIQLPVATPLSATQPAPSVLGLAPLNAILPVQAKPPQHGKPRKK